MNFVSYIIIYIDILLIVWLAAVTIAPGMRNPLYYTLL